MPPPTKRQRQRRASRLSKPVPAPPPGARRRRSARQPGGAFQNAKLDRMEPEMFVNPKGGPPPLPKLDRDLRNPGPKGFTLPGQSAVALDFAKDAGDVMGMSASLFPGTFSNAVRGIQEDFRSPEQAFAARLSTLSRSGRRLGGEITQALARRRGKNLKQDF